ncbi:hypothetical protein ACS0TY_017942 [Phlomoides rotata]
MNSQNQDTKGCGKNERKWKYDEGVKLIKALLDMVNLGAYKAENGFKPGYLKYVEEKLQVSLRNSDRAIGANAEGPSDMMEEIHKEDGNNDEINNEETNMEPGLENFDDSFSPQQSPRSEAVNKQKKRKEEEVQVLITDIKEAASIIGSEIATASHVLCKEIGVDAGISEKRQKIDLEIMKVSNLTASEVRFVFHIAKSHELIYVFFSMTE